MIPYIHLFDSDHKLLYIILQVTQTGPTNIQNKIYSIRFCKFMSTNTRANKLNIKTTYM